MLKAGTGKTTLVRFIIAALGLNPADDVAYISYTGKAAEVLRSKGNPNAQTAHKFLYFSRMTKEGKIVNKPKTKFQLDGYYKLVVVDEISMLPKQMWDLLLSYGIHVIALGDPFQLPPPLSKQDENNVLSNPHIFLSEVQRQALDNEIIKISMQIREGENLTYFKGKNVQIIRPSEIVNGMYRWADQILVATNKDRVRINNLVRALNNRGEEPEEGEKVICLRNQWDITSDGDALVNGTIGYLKNIQKMDKFYPVKKMDFPNPVATLQADIVTDISTGKCFDQVVMDYNVFKNNGKELKDEDIAAICSVPALKGSEPTKVDYGYAITTHKAQGSEWDKIMIITCPGFPRSEIERRRWLYTAITRAMDKAIIVI